MEPKAGVEPRFLIIETAHRQGLVALGAGTRVVDERKLEESRRHARDLVPRTKELLNRAGWKPRDLSAVIVSRGPGSYTGLRVGLMSAKTLAYATGCVLLGIETFQAIALQAPAEAEVLEVIADAQQGKLYRQRFARKPDGCAAQTALTICPIAEWIRDLDDSTWISGPGVELVETDGNGEFRLVPSANRQPTAASLLQLGWERWCRGERDDPFLLEPLYLRPSAAEEKHRATTK